MVGYGFLWLIWLIGLCYWLVLGFFYVFYSLVQWYVSLTTPLLKKSQYPVAKITHEHSYTIQPSTHIKAPKSHVSKSVLTIYVVADDVLEEREEGLLHLSHGGAVEGLAVANPTCLWVVPFLVALEERERERGRDERLAKC